MNLSTRYLGFDLAHPIVPGASPLGMSLDMVRRLEDAGAPMIVLPSLFEEQIVREEHAFHSSLHQGGDSFAESLHFFPDVPELRLGPHEYLEHLGRVRQAVRVPVVASLNGVSPGGWLRHAQSIQQAGADALELNLYQVASQIDESGVDVEQKGLEVVRHVLELVSIPVAVKLSPFYSSLPHFAKQLSDLGTRAIVLFNRFYEPEIDVEHLNISTVLHLSTSDELPMRLRWIGILFGNIASDLAVTGGVHTGLDVVRSVMAGATCVQTVAALLQRGPDHLLALCDYLQAWLEEHEYDSLQQMLGSMSLLRCPQPHAYERVNYIKILQTWE